MQHRMGCQPVISTDLADAIRGLNTADLTVVLPYLGAIGWLVYRAWRRQRTPHLQRAVRATAVADGLVRLLGAAVMVAVVILLALARAAGRSHYRW
jgi:hypothetical protein